MKPGKLIIWTLILPLLLYGACKALPKNSKYMRRSPIVLHVGERVTPQQLNQLGDTVMDLAKWFRKFYINKLSALSNNYES